MVELQNRNLSYVYKYTGSRKQNVFVNIYAADKFRYNTTHDSFLKKIN